MKLAHKSRWKKVFILPSSSSVSLLYCHCLIHVFIVINILLLFVEHKKLNGSDGTLHLHRKNRRENIWNATRGWLISRRRQMRSKAMKKKEKKSKEFPRREKKGCISVIVAIRRRRQASASVGRKKKEKKVSCLSITDTQLCDDELCAKHWHGYLTVMKKRDCDYCVFSLSSSTTATSWKLQQTEVNLSAHRNGSDLFGRWL